MIECSGNPLTFGTNYLTSFTQKLDPFSTIKIGNQEWMMQNLAVDDGLSGISTGHYVVNGVDFGIQYKYTWDAAQRVADSISGFHLPYVSDYNTLRANLGSSANAGYKLKSKQGWYNNGNGINEVGFNALPLETDTFDGHNYPGAWCKLWTRGRVWDGYNYYYSLYFAGQYNSNVAGSGSTSEPNSYLPVRLLRDTV